MSEHNHHPNLEWPRMEPGSPVQGNYYGQRFTGRVISERGHTIAHEVREVYVALDQPLADGRTQVHVSACGACGQGIRGWGDDNEIHALPGREMPGFDATAVDR